MNIKTKYDIGQRLFFIETDKNAHEVRLCEIKEIKVGGKYWEKYVISGGFYGKSRGENDLFTSFEEAKKKAVKNQKETNKSLLERVEQQREPTKLDY